MRSGPDHVAVLSSNLRLHCALVFNSRSEKNQIVWTPVSADADRHRIPPWIDRRLIISAVGRHQCGYDTIAGVDGRIRSGERRAFGSLPARSGHDDVDRAGIGLWHQEV